jgi:L-seryl-tRNA(Ser) seleniumtransferase
MENSETSPNIENLRFLPSIDALLHSQTANKLLPETGAKHLTVLTRVVIDALRRELQETAANSAEFSRENVIAEAEKRLENAWRTEQNTSLQRVINATGVIVHTNLGRAPLSENARKAIFDEASRYCNLEYNLETGKRGKRGAHAEHLLAELTGAESALIVNNCAAAAFLVLTVLAAGSEVVISRGELVEIGGDSHAIRRDFARSRHNEQNKTLRLRTRNQRKHAAFAESSPVKLSNYRFHRRAESHRTRRFSASK